VIHKNDPRGSFTLSCVAASGATTATCKLTREFNTEASILKRSGSGNNVYLTDTYVLHIKGRDAAD
jgi:hypothetical protein